MSKRDKVSDAVSKLFHSIDTYEELWKFLERDIDSNPELWVFDSNSLVLMRNFGGDRELRIAGPVWSVLTDIQNVPITKRSLKRKLRKLRVRWRRIKDEELTRLEDLRLSRSLKEIGSLIWGGPGNE